MPPIKKIRPPGTGSPPLGDLREHRCWAALLLPSNFPNRPGIFAFEVEGECMAPRIQDGDFVLGRQAEPPVTGKPAIVKIRGYLPTVKNWNPARNGHVRLVPTNPMFKAFQFPREEISWACRVLAVVRKEEALIQS